MIRLASDRGHGELGLKKRESKREGRDWGCVLGALYENDLIGFFRPCRAPVTPPTRTKPTRIKQTDHDSNGMRSIFTDFFKSEKMHNHGSVKKISIGMKLFDWYEFFDQYILRLHVQKNNNNPI